MFLSILHIIEFLLLVSFCEKITRNYLLANLDFSALGWIHAAHLHGIPALVRPYS
jgi:hypothetical protein